MAKKVKKAQNGKSISLKETLDLVRVSTQDDLENWRLKAALAKEKREKRDSARLALNTKFPKDYNKVLSGMNDYYKTEPKEYLQLDINLLTPERKNQVLEKEKKRKITREIMLGYQNGGIINDNNGQWTNPGEITRIESNKITMKGVNKPLLGISNTGDTKLMFPNKDYSFSGESVTEFPIEAKSGIHIKKKNRGLLHKNLNVPKGEKIPASKLKIKESDSPALKKRKQFAINAKKWKKGQYGDEIEFSMNDIPQNGTLVELDQYQQPNVETNTNQTVGDILKKGYNKIGGQQGIMQGANAAAFATMSPGGEDGPSTSQKFVGQFGPWGAAISQVSQIGTNYFDKADNNYANNYISSIFDPAATFENKDLSSTDRVLGGLSPTYGAYVKKKARKLKQQKEDKLNALVKQASELEDLDANRRKYVRPEDQLVEPNELYSSYGTGTNFLKHGGKVSCMESGGDLKTYWGGEAELISDNPYLPNGGETIEFKGKSHAEGGIGIKFGNTKVEVEGGEPAVKLDNGKSESLIVFGDMKIPSYGLTELQDPDAKGKKFKNYIKDLSKKEDKQNEIVEKGTKIVNDTKVIDGFDKLKFSSGKAMIEGGNMKLKQIAHKKQLAASIQNAILETADELGLKSNELAKGIIKKEKSSKKKAQDGGKYTIPRSQVDEYQMYGYQLDPEDSNRMFRDLKTSGSSYTLPTTPPKGSEEFNKAFGEARKQNASSFMWKGKQYTTDLFKGDNQTISNPGRTERDYIYLMDEIALPMQEQVMENTAQERTGEAQKAGFDWLSLANSVIPYIRPTNQLPLDPNQLSGEMFALASNQQEPVKAQLYQPLLETISDISLQDQLNANQADFNSLQKYTAQNPAAQATLAAQKYDANTKVLGEEFRLNQNARIGTYNRNRAVLNDATLKNLAILDEQFVRQSQAKSNTKATAQAAINSIADKIARNKLENKTLGIYENLYNYRYDSKGRAWNYNGAAQFVVDSGLIEVDDSGKVVMNENKVKRDKNGIIINSTQTQRSTDKKKNGGIVKSLKTY